MQSPDREVQVVPRPSFKSRTKMKKKNQLRRTRSSSTRSTESVAPRPVYTVPPLGMSNCSLQALCLDLRQWEASVFSQVKQQKLPVKQAHHEGILQVFGSSGSRCRAWRASLSTDAGCSGWGEGAWVTVFFCSLFWLCRG